MFPIKSIGTCEVCWPLLIKIDYLFTLFKTKEFGKSSFKIISFKLKIQKKQFFSLHHLDKQNLKLNKQINNLNNFPIQCIYILSPSIKINSCT